MRNRYVFSDRISDNSFRFQSQRSSGNSPVLVLRIGRLKGSVSEEIFPDSTKHRAPSTKYKAPSTKLQAPSTKHQAPSTKHPYAGGDPFLYSLYTILYSSLQTLQSPFVKLPSLAKMTCRKLSVAIDNCPTAIQHAALQVEILLITEGEIE